jgi:hypothetical protein
VEGGVREHEYKGSAQTLQEEILETSLLKGLAICSAMYSRSSTVPGIQGSQGIRISNDRIWETSFYSSPFVLPELVSCMTGKSESSQLQVGFTMS